MYKYYDQVKIRPSVVFDTVLSMNDPILFYNAYEMMQKICAKSNQKEYEESYKVYDSQFRKTFFPLKKKNIVKREKNTSSNNNAQ